MNKLITQTLLSIGLTGSLLIVGCGDSTDEENANKEVPAKVVTWLCLSEQNTDNQRLLSGKISAAKRTQLSFQAQGQLQRIDVKVGEEFHSGQTLARLDKTNYLLQLQQAQAKLNTAIAQRNQARTEVKRREQLVKSKAVSKSQLDAFRLQLASAQQSINAATAQVNLSQKQLSDTDLIAPFSGTVTAKLAEIGLLVSPKVPILMVEAKQTPEVSFSIPENISNQITKGQVVSVTLPALPDTTLQGNIIEISTQAQQGAFPAKLSLQTPPQSIKTGMTAEIHFNLNVNSDKQAGFNIPPSALGADKDDRHFVYRIIGEKDALQLEKVPVVVSSLSDNHLLVTGKLNANDKLVRSGLGFLYPKQAVILMGEGVKRVNP